MQLTTGTRVLARGLTWDVLVREQNRVRLRCLSDDLQGLEWEFLQDVETVSTLAEALNPRRPGSLAAWRQFHRAAILDEIPGPQAMVAAQPGRLRIEPYQLVPLMRALAMPRPRLLLADGVGLGKTIQAGLIAAELIARRRAHRILIVAPSGPLLRQWEQEMRQRFGLPVTVLADGAALREEQRKLVLGGNPFGATSFVLTSIDFAKQETVLEALERVAWDLAIIDEAHHCVAAHAREDTLRRRLAEVVARQSDGLLLLTATPHDGHDPHFASLIALLDPSLVDGEGGLLGQAYRRHVVRRLKSHIADPMTGRPMFRDRRVIPLPVVSHQPAVQAFHRALSALVVPRLAQGQTSGDALAFVSLLKRSISTVAACVATLRVVAERYGGAAEAASVRRERARALRAYRRRALQYGVLDAGTESDVERLETEEIASELQATGETEAAVRHLIALGEAAAPFDPKLEALVAEIRAIRADEPRANILVYTEYGDSQAAAVAALRGLPGEVLTIGGQDSEDARTQAADRCATEDNIVLISTDSLAEGLNLQQRCHHLIHLDLPYNPNRLEQRNGRIDRYGQTETPEIRYLCLAGTFEERLLLRLIAKYEKARAQLEVMPDTLGMTADEAQYNAHLLSGLAEEQASLFPDDKAPIRTLDIAARETETETFRGLLHEIDRAYEGFDSMAVRHGWFAGQGLSADVASMRAAIQLGDGARRRAGLVDIHAFVGAGAAPAGRADPIVRHAIGRARFGDDNRVAVAHHERRAMLLTYIAEIRTQRASAWHRIVAVLAPEQGPVEVMTEPEQWLALAEHEIDSPNAWRQFKGWASAKQDTATAVATQFMREQAALFTAQHADALEAHTAQRERWLARRCNAICGPRLTAPADLFGATPIGPIWRHAASPLERLIAFAADMDNPAAARREAEAVGALYDRGRHDLPILSEPVLHALGMLLLVPEA